MASFEKKKKAKDIHMASLDDHQITVEVYDETTQKNKSVTYHALPPPPHCNVSTHQTKWWLLLLYCAFMAIGVIGSPLAQKLYYLHGGNLKWLATWVQSVGFPILLIPLSFTYFRNLSQNSNDYEPMTKAFTFMDSKLFAYAAAAGVVSGLSSFTYSWSMRYLPVSTSTLLTSMQLAFTALFAFLMVNQKFSFYSVNSVALMTMGAAALVVQTSGDRPAGVREGEYLLGFSMMLGSTALSGLMMPLVELGYSKSTVPVNYAIVMQFQVVLCLFANFFCTIGMLINKDFQKITTEASEYELGESEYYGVILGNIVISQVLALGVVGVVHTASSLFAGMFAALLLPVTEVFALLAFNEKFTGEKGLALALCLWGFSSYFIGEYKRTDCFDKNDKS